MRLVRLGVALMVAALVGATGASLVAALVATGSGPRATPRPEATSPPTGLGSGAPPPLRVHITPPAGTDLRIGADEALDLPVTVENPNAAPVSGLTVVAEADGGTCAWVEGPFPQPFGLAPAGTSTRTCRLRLTGDGPATLRVTARVGGEDGAEAAQVVGWRSAPSSAPAPPGSPGGTAPAPSIDPRTPSSAPTIPPPPTVPAPPPCPRLRAGSAAGVPVAAERIGPAVAELGRLVDLGACPAWVAVADLAATPTAGACPRWELAGGPAGLWATVEADPATCDPSNLSVVVTDQPSATAAMVATLAAWAADGRADEAPVWYRAAITGVAPPCPPGGTAVTGAHELTTGTARSYRARVVRC